MFDGRVAGLKRAHQPNRKSASAKQKERSSGQTERALANDGNHFAAVTDQYRVGALLVE